MDELISRLVKKGFLLERHVVEGSEREEITASHSWWDRFFEIVGSDSEDFLEDIEQEMNEELAVWREEHDDDE